MSTSQDFLRRAWAAALDAGHIFPEFAACEAALESGWGESRLAKQYNNLFGQKQGQVIALPYPSIVLETGECLPDGTPYKDRAAFLWFPDWTTACRERMALLRRLPRYQPALAAIDGREFVELVSPAWATDPQRAAKVLQIYDAHKVFA